MDWLETSFALDRTANWLRGRDMDHTKKPALEALARVLDEQRVPWALIGGMALQAHVEDPRFTHDIDIAVPSRSLLPRAALAAAGFRETGRFPYSDNFEGFGVPVQFSDDAPLAEVLSRAQTVRLDDVGLRIVSALDLLRAKLRAAAAPEWRKSKALQDLADIEALLERHPPLEDALSPDERQQRLRLPSEIAARIPRRTP